MAITGIGGLFFRSGNPEKLMGWYKTHLGVEMVTKEERDTPETGRFARIQDPEGNVIELWEPPVDP